MWQAELVLCSVLYSAEAVLKNKIQKLHDEKI